MIAHDTTAGKQRVIAYRYELLSRLGQGGMADVWDARDAVTGARVAVKLLRDFSEGRRTSLARFRREAEALARLDHAHVVQILDWGLERDQPFFVMERVEGRSLQDMIEERALDRVRLVGLIEAVARALHEAHEQGVVPRDVNPSNILVSTDGTPKLADFGIALVSGDGLALTQPGMVIGTPNFMAPEQMFNRKNEIGRATDVWGLGATLYAGLAGAPPFPDGAEIDELARRIQSPPRPLWHFDPRIPAELEAIVRSAMVLDPLLRYPSALEFAADLRRYAIGEPVRAIRLGRRERGRIVWARFRNFLARSTPNS